MFPVRRAVLSNREYCVPERYALFECKGWFNILFSEAHADRILVCCIRSRKLNLNISVRWDSRIFQVCKCKRIVFDFFFWNSFLCDCFTGFRMRYSYRYISKAFRPSHVDKYYAYRASVRCSLYAEFFTPISKNRLVAAVCVYAVGYDARLVYGGKKCDACYGSYPENNAVLFRHIIQVYYNIEDTMDKRTIILFTLFFFANLAYLHRVPGFLGDEASEGENAYQILTEEKSPVLGERSYIGVLTDYVRMPFIGVLGYSSLAIRLPVFF